VDHHSDQLLVQGFLKYRESRGCCEIRGAGPNLWFAAAQSLGFWVSTIWCAFTPFVDLITPFCRGARSFSPTSRRFNKLPDVVFLDLGALPWGPGSSKYWEGWRTTHVFFCLGEDADASGPRTATSPPPVPAGVVLPVGYTWALGGGGGHIGPMDSGGMVSLRIAVLGATPCGPAVVVSFVQLHQG
jgi:hypothetical protein